MRSSFRHRNSSGSGFADESWFGPEAAFSLLEVLVTVSIVVVILVAVLEVVASIERSWKATATDSFAEAQDAFINVTQNLAGATLETYQDYADSSGSFRTTTTSTFIPDHLARRSDLAFVCGPSSGTSGLLTASGRTTAGCAVFFLMRNGYSQTESGMEHLLNAMGYFVEFGTETDVPSFLSLTPQRWRWRLKEVRQPSESLQIYATTSSASWIQPLVASPSTTPALADNVIALVVLPERAASDSGTALAPDFGYDSRDSTKSLTYHQLPPRLRVALVAIDELSAQVLAAKNGANPPALVASNLFQKSAQLDANLNSLDATLTAQKIKHRLFQREILLPSAAWSNASLP